jgi:hypothetical protein
VARERNIKIAFIFNIARFARWQEPAFPEADAPLWLCILGDRAFADAAMPLRGRAVGGHTMEVRSVPDVRRAAGCHLLYIPGDRLDGYFRETANRPIPHLLTIADVTGLPQADALERQPVLALYSDGNRIRFSIDLGLATASGLILSSELLKLGRVLKDSGGAE